MEKDVERLGKGVVGGQETGKRQRKKGEGSVGNQERFKSGGERRGRRGEEGDRNLFTVLSYTKNKTLATRT